MSVGDAWILQLREDSYVAIGSLELVHIHPDIPEVIAAQNEEAYCQKQVLWQEQELPLLDLDLFLYDESSNDKTIDNTENIFLCVITYMSAQENRQEYGAILSSQLPVRLTVDDEQACELPDSPAAWSKLAISCFSHDIYGIVPILDLPHIFSAHSVQVADSGIDSGFDSGFDPFD